MGKSNPDGTMALRKGIEGSTPVSTRWLGVLFREDDIRVYGHVTATSMKILCVVSGENILESKIKTLLASIHVAYIHYIMNPANSSVVEFLDHQGEIRSARFDRNIRAAVADFHRNQVPPPTTNSSKEDQEKN